MYNLYSILRTCHLQDAKEDLLSGGKNGYFVENSVTIPSTGLRERACSGGGSTFDNCVEDRSAVYLVKGENMVFAQKF